MSDTKRGTSVAEGPAHERRSVLPAPVPRPGTEAYRNAKRIVVIGAGPGGLCAAIRLRAAGYDNVVLLEKASGVGGTWWHNRYPGAACDVRSNLYSFSFEPKLDWTRPYATQPEILSYMEHVADAYGVLPLIRFDTEARRATWDDASRTWTVSCENGENFTADFVVSAVGMFNELYVPEIEGLDSFAGKQFHSARWDHDHDLSGERVAVIGSAASAVQFVPEIAGKVAQLHVFQRSANWVAPKDDVPYTAEEIARHVADAGMVADDRETQWHRVETFICFDRPQVLALMEKTVLQALEVVDDPAVRSALTPSVPYGSHRPLISNEYYPTFNRANVELVTEPIRCIEPDGVVTADGKKRLVDTLVLATGFRTTKYASTVDVCGRDGVRLADAWSLGARAYLGITTPGFPNLFMLYGPNTNNGSILFMIECQVDYLVRHLQHLEAENLAVSEVRADVTHDFNEQLQRDLDAVEVWRHHTRGYYRGESGQIVTQWPFTMARYREVTTADDRTAYSFA